MNIIDILHAAKRCHFTHGSQDDLLEVIQQYAKNNLTRIISEAVLEKFVEREGGLMVKGNGTPDFDTAFRIALNAVLFKYEYEHMKCEVINYFQEQVGPTKENVDWINALGCGYFFESLNSMEAIVAPSKIIQALEAVRGDRTF